MRVVEEEGGGEEEDERRVKERKRRGREATEKLIRERFRSDAPWNKDGSRREEAGESKAGSSTEG